MCLLTFLFLFIIPSLFSLLTSISPLYPSSCYYLFFSPVLDPILTVDTRTTVTKKATLVAVELNICRGSEVVFVLVQSFELL